MAKNNKIDKEKLRQEMDDIKQEYKDDHKEMSAKLKELLKNEIAENRKRDKTRGAEMISIFAAHNYYAGGFTPVELRTTLEDLGPTYVKIGQIMSSRPDLLPENYCKELEKLRQNVKPLDPQIARAVIEDETGKEIDEIFSEFKDEPLGSASIGQAHYGVLKDGTKVVIKVQRPLIAEMTSKDYALLKKLAKLVNVVVDDEEGQAIDLVSVIEELEKVTKEELDFRIEANNTKFFKENCIEDEEKISCPTVIDELTTERIFTMTFVDGYTIAKTERMKEDGLDQEEIGKVISENYIHQIFDVGTFHADPHQGNIMVSGGKPYWIDFGMIGRISDKDMATIEGIVLALLSDDTEGVVDGVLAMGKSSASTNRDKLVDDASVFVNRISNSKSISDLDMSDIFSEITDLASKHHVQLPGEFTMLGRSFLAMEGVLEQLCPELDFFGLLSNKMTERMKNSFDIKKTILDIGKDLLSTGKKATKIPGLAADAMTSLTKGRMKINFELTGLDEPLEKIGNYVYYVVLIIIACVLFLGSCLLCMVDIRPKTSSGMPLIALAGILFAVALAIYSVKKLFNRK